ncbi:hypothetical protein J421_4109 [Gemmatirosa kalamazoonensis]|uniref:Uncharacterized protein n=1 Tax=Gemmatirosa kalamazoonensis TaxID=861299 RepID=W0RLJ6_9BACT|nr:hypothetical protein [Gemmatirosa kalamazoonensis]AHG91646.1 hypothetical protein J421_4109 [Gemmatirosa kalamazoonensis]
MQLPLVALTLLSLATAQPPRPIVLIVHGRGQAGRDSAALRRDALDALREGARAATGRALLDDDDVRVVWYADLLAARGTTGGCGDDVRLPVAKDSPLGVFAQVAGALLDAVASAARSDAPNDSSTRELGSLAGDLHFLGDPGSRCAAERRVGDALARARREHRPVVLVARSLGGLVAWGDLLRDTTTSRAPLVYRLVTLGSPVASADVRRLLFGDERSADVPPGVGSWRNVVGEGDPFAAHATSIDSLADSARVADLRTESPHRDDPHGLLGYLRDPTTARAVIGAWCDAARRSDASCMALRTPR